MRLFIAVPIPKHSIDVISKIQGELRLGLGNSFRWTNPVSIHLTVKFLGETPPSKISEIVKSLKEICDSVPKFSILCASVGVFPNNKQPKVIWLGLESTPELMKLQREIEKNLALQGFEEEKRTFSPHLTLGRVQINLLSSELTFLKSKMDKYESKKISTFPVEYIELIKSDLKPSGPIYTTQRIFPLKAVL